MSSWGNKPSPRRVVSGWNALSAQKAKYKSAHKSQGVRMSLPPAHSWSAILHCRVGFYPTIMDSKSSQELGTQRRWVAWASRGGSCSLLRPARKVQAQQSLRDHTHLLSPRACSEGGSPASAAGPSSLHRLHGSRTPCYRG